MPSCPVDRLCQLASESVHSFSSLVADDERMNARMDGHTEERTDSLRTLCFRLPVWLGGGVKRECRQSTNVTSACCEYNVDAVMVEAGVVVSWTIATPTGPSRYPRSRSMPRPRWFVTSAARWWSELLTNCSGTSANPGFTAALLTGAPRRGQRRTEQLTATRSGRPGYII